MKVLKYSEVKEKFNAMLKDHSVEEIEKELIAMIAGNPSDSLKYKKSFFSLIKDMDPTLAFKYGEKIIKEEEDPKFMKVLAVRYKRIGGNTKYDALMNKKIPMTIFKNELDEFVHNKVPFDEIEEHIDLFISQHPKLKLPAYKVAFSKLKDAYTTEAVKYGEEVIKKEQDPKFIKVLAARYRKIGDLKKYEILNSL